MSHNQSFINRLATKIWDIREGQIIEYPGDLEAYFCHIAGTEEGSADGCSQGTTHEQGWGGKASVRKREDRKEEKREKAGKRQLAYNTLKPILAEVDRLEGRIAELEVRQEEVEKLLADPDIFSDKNRSVPLLNEYKALRDDLDALLLKWEQRQDQLEATRSELESGGR